MNSTNHNKILKNINHLIDASQKILIVVSKPIDPDCIGTGLSLKWFLSENRKKADIVRFINIPQEMTSFPDIENITQIDNELPDFNIYDAVILVDGCDWAQFFGDNWQEILNHIDKNKIINLDHHIPGNIQQAVPDNCLVKSTSCTGQLLFEYFIEPSNIKLTKPVADYLYLALLYDSVIKPFDLPFDSLLVKFVKVRPVFPSLFCSSRLKSLLMTSILSFSSGKKSVCSIAQTIKSSSFLS